MLQYTRNTRYVAVRWNGDNVTELVALTTWSSVKMTQEADGLKVLLKKSGPRGGSNTMPVEVGHYVVGRTTNSGAIVELDVWDGEDFEFTFIPTDSQNDDTATDRPAL